MVEDPELFQKALELERNADRDGLYLGDKRLSSIYQENKLTNYISIEKQTKRT